MAIAYESDGGTVFCALSNNNAVTIPLPATRPVGSVLLIVAFNQLITSSVTTAPSGYTLFSGWPKTSGTASGGRMWLYYRVVTGSETAPTIAMDGTTGTSGDMWGACMYCYSGVDVVGGVPTIDASATPTDASGTTTCTYPAITTATANAMVIRFLVRFRDAADTFTPTGSPAHNEREDASTTNRLGGQHHLQDMIAASAGTQAAVTVAPSNTTAARYLATSVALKVAVTVATVPLASANAGTTTTAALTAPTGVPLAAAGAVATTTLAATASTQIPLQASTVVASTTLNVVVPRLVPLAAAYGHTSLQPNPTHEDSFPGWNAGAFANDVGTAVQSSEQAHSGTYSTKVTRTAAGSGVVDLYDNNGSRWPAVVAGRTYLFSFWAYPTQARDFRVEFNIRDTGNAFLDVSVGANVACSANGWTLVTHSFRAPVGAGYVLPIAYGLGLSQNESCYVDDWWLEQVLTLSAPTQPPLQTAAATSNTTLALTAPAKVPLGTAAGQSSATLALTAKAQVVLQATTASSSASLALTTKTQIPLGPSNALSSASLAVEVLGGPAVIPLAAANASSSAALSLTAKTAVPLNPAVASASATLALTVPSLPAEYWSNAGTVAWSSEQAHSGSYSAKVTVTT